MSKRFPGATQTRRGARGGFPEHDDFEGLPVRQWRQEPVNIAPPPLSEPKEQNDRWAVELPYGLPKEFPLLPPHTQELLRAARSGRLYKRSAEEDEPDVDGPDGKGDKKDVELVTGGYVVKTWRQIPRNSEGPTVSHLAKRHKNTITISSKAAAPAIPGPTVRRVTVRKIDAAGNPYERTVTLNEGQTVDGEIISETNIPAPSASTGELTPQLTPVKKRPPPPKRKPKGPGRGRKKGMLPLPLPASHRRSGEEDGSDARDESDNADGARTDENEDNMVQDSEMAEHSAVPSDEEEEVEDGEEGGDNEESGETPDADASTNRDVDQDQEMQDSDVSAIGEPEEEDMAAQKSRFPPPALGTLAPLHGPLHLNSPRIEGSPLKHVMVQSPTEPSPMASPRVTSAGVSFSTTSYMEVLSTTTVSNGLVVTVSERQLTAEMDFPMSAGGKRGSVSRANRIEELPSTTGGTNATFPTPCHDQGAAPPTVEISPAPSDTPQLVRMSLSPADESRNEADRTPLEPPKSPALRPAVTADEDDGLNLLGSLERELDRQESMSNAGSCVGDQKLTPPAASAEDRDASAQPTTLPALAGHIEAESPVVKEEDVAR